MLQANYKILYIYYISCFYLGDWGVNSRTKQRYKVLIVHFFLPQRLNGLRLKQPKVLKLRIELYFSLQPINNFTHIEVCC